MNTHEYIQQFIREELPSSSLSLLQKLYQEDEAFRKIVDEEDRAQEDQTPESGDELRILPQLFSLEEAAEILFGRETEPGLAFPKANAAGKAAHAQRQSYGLRFGDKLSAATANFEDLLEKDLEVDSAVEALQDRLHLAKKLRLCFSCYEGRLYLDFLYVPPHQLRPLIGKVHLGEREFLAQDIDPEGTLCLGPARQFTREDLLQTHLEFKVGEPS